jgi:hypothetical protein
MATMTASQTTGRLGVRPIDSRLAWGLLGVVLAAAAWQTAAARLGPVSIAPPGDDPAPGLPAPPREHAAGVPGRRQ